MADARDIACDILDVVLTDGAPMDRALASHGGLANLDPRDRAQARRIVATVLRRLGEIDAVLRTLLDRPLQKRHGRIRNVLRIGIAELLFLETPAHAAVDAGVRVAARYRRGALKGLVNAILRRADRERDRRPEAGPESNTPNWLFSRWVDAYGAETAGRIAQSHLIEPPLDITLARQDEAERWAARLAAEALPGGTLRRAGGRVAELEGFDDGAWWIQDAAAALPVRLLGEIAGKNVIDLCAAPGGKTLQLAAAGANVTAVDVADARIGSLQENLARTGLDAEIVCADAIAWRPERPADAVLLDAPCTATGTIRRHPDIPHRRRPGDIEKARTLQARLLAAALDMVRPGGVVVYAVCSLEPEEGPDQISTILDGDASVRLDPLDPGEWPELADTSPPAVTPDGMLRTLPCHWPERGGMDGFFAARLVRS
ncbi:MAG: methyltransferase [Alphaproteobacteria bacterium]|nr:methyltransferase [Alphaproteobacteria bacterium]